jgi:hypothetical protein
MDTELRELGGEVDQVTREKATMNTKKCTVDLQYCQRVEVALQRHATNGTASSADCGLGWSILGGG